MGRMGGHRSGTRYRTYLLTCDMLRNFLVRAHLSAGGQRHEVLLPGQSGSVDPSFDFCVRATRRTACGIATTRMRTNCFSTAPMTACLVSKGIVDGVRTRAVVATRSRNGIVFFASVPGNSSGLRRPGMLPVIGDCGAFTYVREKTPPYTVDEVIDFYNECGFDYGISVDHVILAFQPSWDARCGTPCRRRCRIARR